jgi:hypothetical protein
MGFGIGPGPEGSGGHQSSAYVYDLRTGVILGTFYFHGASKDLDDKLQRRLSEQIHEVSGVPLEHIAVLSGRETPAGEGPLRVDTATKRLIRTAPQAGLARIRA